MLLSALPFRCKTIQAESATNKQYQGLVCTLLNGGRLDNLDSSGMLEGKSDQKRMFKCELITR